MDCGIGELIEVPPPPLSLYSLQAYAQIYCQMLVEILKLHHNKSQVVTPLILISMSHPYTTVQIYIRQVQNSILNHIQIDPRGGILKINYNSREKERRKQ